MLFKLATLALLATSAFAHSNMSEPKPRKNQDHVVFSKGESACETGSTSIPGENNFKRGQKVPLKWWWNNHSGGFIKMAIIPKVVSNPSAADKAALLKNENIIQGSCYTMDCNRKGFDKGQTHNCNGPPLELPNWLKDGDYTLQWTHFGGYDSDGVATRQLPIYQTCANIRIKGGAALQPKPADWIAPFFGGDQVKINGKSAGKDQCAFKNFNKQPEDPKTVNIRDDRKDNIKFGGPAGWAAVGKTNKKRMDGMVLPRLGRVARNAQPLEEGHYEGDGHDHEEEVEEIEEIEDDEE